MPDVFNCTLGYSVSTLEHVRILVHVVYHAGVAHSSVANNVSMGTLEILDVPLMKRPLQDHAMSNHAVRPFLCQIKL